MRESEKFWSHLQNFLDKSSAGAQPILKKSLKGLGRSPTSFCEMQRGWILQKARCGYTRALLAKYESSVWILTGFACYSAIPMMAGAFS